jgi:hypothetical protein
MPNLRSVLASLAAAAILAGAAPALAQKACSAGALLMGNPRYQGAERPDPKGAGTRDDPPHQFRSLVFRGSNVFTNDGQELWIADLRESKMKRYAGEHQPAWPKLKDGPCAEARFMNIHGVASLPDGDLVVADYTGHAILKVTNPATPECTVSYLAGASAPAEREGKRGDEDGPGAAAKLSAPEWPVSDDEGNIYFIDSGTKKLRKIAADAEHTVSTVAQLFDNKQYGYVGLTMLDDKLYAVGNTFSNALIFEIDPATGATRKVLDGGSKVFRPVDATTAPSLSAVTNDGKHLLVSGQGYIWRVTTEGKVTHLAGSGSPIEFPRTYDVVNSHPAKKAVLRFRNGDVSIMGTTTSLAYQNGVIFWRGRSDGSYVMSFRCN